MTREEAQDYIDQQLPDNDEEIITPLKLRNVFTLVLNYVDERYQPQPTQGFPFTFTPSYTLS